MLVVARQDGRVDGEDSTLGRREALSLFGLIIAAAACSGSGKGVTSPTPSSTLAPTRGRGPTVAGTTTSAPPAVVRGRNAALDHAILADDAPGYNGRWRGEWSIVGGSSGVISGTVTIDPDARTLTAIFDPGIALLGGSPLPGFRVEGSVDSFVYDANTGAFHIVQTTPVGVATLESAQGIGSGTFKLTGTSIPKHVNVERVVATGVVNRAGRIPVQFTITRTDGVTQTGSMTLAPVGRA